MILNLSDVGADPMLDALGVAMDGGSIEILSDNQRVLAVLKLSTPAAMPAADSALELNAITEEPSAAQGTASIARILARNGSEVFSCDVGDRNSDAVIKLSTVQISAGAPVRIDSFRLAMP